jgi:hypothetical protein
MGASGKHEICQGGARSTGKTFLLLAGITARRAVSLSDRVGLILSYSFDVSYLVKLNSRPRTIWTAIEYVVISGLLKKLVIVLFSNWTMQKNDPALMIGHTSLAQDGPALKDVHPVDYCTFDFIL